MAGQMSVIDRFTLHARAVSAKVKRLGGIDAVMAYALDLCERKKACQLLMSGCGEPLSDDGGALCDTKQQKIIAAPDLDRSLVQPFAARCAEKGIVLNTGGLEEHLAGVDIGLTRADYGIADTGTLVIDSGSEDVRLATMVSEIHLAFLPVSRIYPSAESLATQLQDMMSAAPNYTAFITGASRTADIERVLAIGVHGPLELHILLTEA